LLLVPASVHDPCHEPWPHDVAGFVLKPRPRRARESTGSGGRVGYAATPAADRLPESLSRASGSSSIAAANSVPAGSKSPITAARRTSAAREDV